MDYFNGIFPIPGIPSGGISGFITHTIPNTILSGSTYCFTNTIYWNIHQMANLVIWTVIQIQFDW